MKRHDYFTSALPWPTKNGASVSLPLGTSAPINSPTDSTFGIYSDTQNAYTKVNVSSFSNASLRIPVETPSGNLYADLSDAAAATINQLREAFQIQRLYERDARGGTRYTEILQSHFGVTSPDARLQRPEYLGGQKTALQMQPIPQTSSTDSTSPQGNLAAIGTLQSRGIRHTNAK